MAYKPSRKKRKLARERVERAKQHELPAASLSSAPSRGRAVLTPGGSERTRRTSGTGEDPATDAEASAEAASSGPRPNPWRRLPAGARLGIILALTFALAGGIIAALRSGSDRAAPEPKSASDAGATK